MIRCLAQAASENRHDQRANRMREPAVAVTRALANALIITLGLLAAAIAGPT